MKPAAAAPLPALKLRFPLLQERRDTLAEVAAREQRELTSRLAIERVGQRAAEARVGRALDLRERQRWAFGEPRGERLDARGELAARHDAIDQADAQRLFGADQLAGQHQL